MNGVIHTVKPPGMTSSSLVVALKRILNTKRVGHTGTLDPGACGVLSVCVGRATKVADYLMSGKKTYIAGIRFGVATDTLDSYGKIIETDGSSVGIDELRNACVSFLGEQGQIPPMYSAIKVNGQKMYQLARQGKEILLPARKITIYSIELLDFDQGENSCLLRIECSKGTYIRTLCGDIAKKMDTIGYVSFLLRTQSGAANISDAYTLNEIEELAHRGDYSFFDPVDAALSGMKDCILEDYLFPIITTGTPIDLARIKNSLGIPRKMDLRVYCGGKFIGIGRAEENTLKIKTMIYIGGEED